MRGINGDLLKRVKCHKKHVILLIVAVEAAVLRVR